MTNNVRDWTASVVNPNNLKGKRVLEIGSLNVNGTIRDLFEPYCQEYIGSDMRLGPGVDRVVDSTKLDTVFERDSFDCIVSCDTFEHIEDWKSALKQAFYVLKPGGKFYFTTVFPGYPKHDYPNDFWRWTVEDVNSVFGCQKLSFCGIKIEGRCIWWTGEKTRDFTDDDFKVELFRV
jgi:SAM-dependent methyltransferase